jgi:hypothetical protein
MMKQEWANLIKNAEKKGMLDDLATVLVARCIEGEPEISPDISVEWGWRDAGGKWWSNQAHGVRVGDWLLCWLDTRPSGGQIEAESLIQCDTPEEAAEFLKELVEDWGGPWHAVRHQGTYVKSTW